MAGLGYPPQERILQILSQLDLFFERIVERPAAGDILSDATPACCYLCCLVPHCWCIYGVMYCHIEAQIKQKAMTPLKFMLHDDMLEIKSIEKTEQFSVKAEAIIVELSYNKLIFKVNVFDTAQKVYKL